MRISDWSSDVCSSDLRDRGMRRLEMRVAMFRLLVFALQAVDLGDQLAGILVGIDALVGGAGMRLQAMHHRGAGAAALVRVDHLHLGRLADTRQPRTIGSASWRARVWQNE